MEIGLAKGKRNYDKRQVLAERDAKRETERALKGRAATDAVGTLEPRERLAAERRELGETVARSRSAAVSDARPARRP